MSYLKILSYLKIVLSVNPKQTVNEMMANDNDFFRQAIMCIGRYLDFGQGMQRRLYYFQTGKRGTPCVFRYCGEKNQGNPRHGTGKK